MAHRVLHLMEFSLRHELSTYDFADDMRWATTKDADMISFTELTSKGDRQNFLSIMRNNGYRPHLFARDGIAVKVDDQIRVTGRGSKKSTPRRDPSGTGQANYVPCYVSWVRTNFYGKPIFYHVSHWQAHLQADPRRVKDHIQTSHDMSRWVRKHGNRKNSLAFFSGDLNWDPDDHTIDNRNSPNTIFKQYGLRTCFMDFGYTPTRNNRSVDIIGRYVRDKAVDPKRYKVHPQQGSDHRPISAWYDIDLSTTDGDSTTPTSGDTMGSDDVFSAGNVDWSDYQYDDVYPMPYAIDDSDHTHA